MFWSKLNFYYKDKGVQLCVKNGFVGHMAVLLEPKVVHVNILNSIQTQKGINNGSITFLIDCNNTAGPHRTFLCYNHSKRDNFVYKRTD